MSEQVKYIRNDAVNPSRGGDQSLAWPMMEHGWVVAQTNANSFLKHLCNGADVQAEPWPTADGVARQQTLRIFFEDLVCKPEQTLSTICELVGIAFDHDMKKVCIDPPFTQPYRST